MRNYFAAVLSGLLLIMLFSPAHAAEDEDWVSQGFEVPVEVKNLSSRIGYVSVSCNVSFRYGDEAMGMEPKERLDSDGSLNKVFPVVVRYKRYRQENVKEYHCYLVLYNRIDGSLFSGSTMILTQQSLALDPSARQVVIVSGKL